MSLPKARRLLGVLYDFGLTLESLVHELLGELEAEVTPPPNNEADDGTLITPSGSRVVLEVKGRRGPINVDDARQLNDWVNLRTYPDDDSEPEEWKGLMIGNPFRHLPLAERTDEPFTLNCVRVAVQDGHALITAAQLIDALAQKQSGDFDAEAWWGKVVQTVGALAD